jgi:hypothetical protein
MCQPNQLINQESIHTLPFVTSTILTLNQHDQYVDLLHGKANGTFWETHFFTNDIFLPFGSFSSFYPSVQSIQKHPITLNMLCGTERTDGQP